MKQTQTGSKKAGSFTFGIEIECLVPESAPINAGWYHSGNSLYDAGFPGGWNAQRDGSVQTLGRMGMKAVEIVSPVLQGRDGIEQVKAVAKILNEMGARVNRTCGFHIHVGLESVAGKRYADQAAWIGRLLYQTAAHEKAMYASTGTRSREQGNFCGSIKQRKQLASGLLGIKAESRGRSGLANAASTSRYASVNLTNILNPSKCTVEFRFAAGTTDWKKMLGHIQTALAICERATETAKLDWDGVANEATYGDGAGAKELNRFFYLTGWTLGRRQVGQAEVNLAGWIADIADLDEVKAELRRLAKKYDAS
jgi:hypothetical protein